MNLSPCLVTALLASLLGACTNRPIGSEQPHGLQSARLTQEEQQPSVGGRSVLFVVDDSVSMADKHKVLASTLNTLLFTPGLCSPALDNPERPVRGVRLPVDGACPDGWRLSTNVSFERAAVITTSLEAGGEACSTSSRAAHPLSEPNDDDSRLVSQIADLEDAGCGFEAPLEAMYRFLVDPEPPEQVHVETEGATRTFRSGIDQKLLSDRAAFLEPLSDVLIVILTDEDDCSIRDFGDAYRVGRPERAPRATSLCATSPDDPCCRSCDAPPEAGLAHCLPVQDDPACALGHQLTEEEDPPNLRCFDQKRRFGTDYLFPVQRYTNALTAPTITDSQGDAVENPLFASGRTPDMVRVLLLSGTPWQLVTSQRSQADTHVMEFLSPSELDASGAWERILGDPSRAISPSDIHVVSQVSPRAGMPLAGAGWDPISGHDVTWPNQDSLQPSCLFNLPEPRDCSTDAECVCHPSHATQLPSCQAPDGSHTSTQYRATAEPSPRLLQFVRGLGNTGDVASICPRNLDPPVMTPEGTTTAPGFGYSEAFSASFVRAGAGLQSACFASPLPEDSEGNLLCRVLEMHEGDVDCLELGRSTPPKEYEDKMKQSANRTSTAELPITICELPQFAASGTGSGSSHEQCTEERHPKVTAPGWCYIDPSEQRGNPDLVSFCHSNHRRWVRFLPAHPASYTTSVELYCDYP